MTTVTIVGNVTMEPELRFTQSGDAVANFNVAENSRYFDRDKNEWIDGDPTFWRCNVWRQQAENVVESINKGDRVIVTGRVKQNNYETKQGEKRTSFEVEVAEVGVALMFGTVTGFERNEKKDKNVNKNSRSRR